MRNQPTAPLAAAACCLTHAGRPPTRGYSLPSQRMHKAVRPPAAGRHPALAHTQPGRSWRLARAVHAQPMRVEALRAIAAGAHAALAPSAPTLARGCPPARDNTMGCPRTGQPPPPAHCLACPCRGCGEGRHAGLARVDQLRTARLPRCTHFVTPCWLCRPPAAAVCHTCLVALRAGARWRGPSNVVLTRLDPAQQPG